MYDSDLTEAITRQKNKRASKMSKKITAICIKYLCEENKTHDLLAIVNGNPSTPMACVKAMQKCDNVFVKSCLFRHPLKEILECQTVSQNASN